MCKKSQEIFEHEIKIVKLEYFESHTSARIDKGTKDRVQKQMWVFKRIQCI